MKTNINVVKINTEIKNIVGNIEVNVTGNTNKKVEKINIVEKVSHSFTRNLWVGNGLAVTPVGV